MAYEIIQLWAKSSRYTAGGNSRQYIVVHNTANTASAKQEAQNLHNNSGKSSFQYAVDDTSIYQCVHDYDTAWAVGAWKGATAYIRNNQSISIEVCNPGTEFSAASKDRLHWLVRDLMEYYGIPADHVVRHWDCHSGHKACPAYYAGSNNKAWKELHALITSPYGETKKKLDDGKIDNIPNQAYTGKAVTPKLTSPSGATFSVAYSDNVEVGYGKAKATGTGDWEGTVTKQFKILPNSLVPFSDVDPTAWYVDSLDAGVMRGFINGYGNGKIGPNDKCTRGQACCFIANEEGVDLDGPFSDVQAAPYYYEAVNWAEETGIVNGDNDEFWPDDDCTREQFACMIHNLYGNPEDTGDPSSFTDWKDVSSWAKKAVAWCIHVGIISGNAGKIRPHDPILRCEVVAMLVNMQEVK